MMRPGISSTSTNSGRFPRSGRTPATAPAPGSLRGRGCRTFRTTAYGNPYTGKGEPERGRGSPPPRRRLSTWGALGHGRCVPNGSTGKCEQGFCRPRSAGGTGGIVPRPRGGDTPGRSRERESDATRCGEPVPAPVQDFRQGPRLPSFSAGSTSGAQRARACPHAGQQCVRHRGIRCTRDSADTCGALGHGGRRVIPGARPPSVVPSRLAPPAIDAATPGFPHPRAHRRRRGGDGRAMRSRHHLRRSSTNDRTRWKLCTRAHFIHQNVITYHIGHFSIHGLFMPSPAPMLPPLCQDSLPGRQRYQQASGD